MSHGKMHMCDATLYTQHFINTEGGVTWQVLELGALDWESLVLMSGKSMQSGLCTR